MSDESSVRSVETEGTGRIQSRGHLGSVTSLPVGWTGPRIVSFLPDHLPEPLQATMLSFGLPPQRVQGGRLVQEVGVTSNWTLELSVSLSGVGGGGIFSSLLTDRAESPAWESGSVENEVDLW